MVRLSGEKADSFLLEVAEASNRLFETGFRDVAVVIADVVGELTAKKEISERVILLELAKKTKNEKSLQIKAKETLLSIFRRFQDYEEAAVSLKPSTS